MEVPLGLGCFTKVTPRISGLFVNDYELASSAGSGHPGRYPPRRRVTRRAAISYGPLKGYTESGSDVLPIR